MIDKNKLFPSSELFKFNTDSPAINRAEKRVRKKELAIKYTRKTVRVYQNKKSLALLVEKLKNCIYQHNKFDLFKVVEREIDERLSQSIKSQFDKLEEVKKIG
ncbi:hypothetical protein TU57_10570 [Bacillus cereus]|uniref:hypothetical protein n=1 Tax=Bacillus cereus group TaxID=86661 RepID=UPI00065C1ADC|nr:hypothetical protein [Bacillus cereus]KMP65182.1 hypothetical protein TU57_10570 [Bacillus cereus]